VWLRARERICGAVKGGFRERVVQGCRLHHQNLLRGLKGQFRCSW
jgi:hypothetical protein